MASVESDEEDVRIVHRVQAGDSDAFRAIVLKYGDRMLSFCRTRSAGEEDAADAAQETFVRAFRSLGSFRLGGSFAAWLFAIAANRTRTGFGRRVSLGKKIARMGQEIAAAKADDPEEEVLHRLEGEAIRESVRSLSKELRMAVELYYFAELSIGEAAQAMGVGEEAVKSRLFRARKKLREILEGRNGDEDHGVV